VNCYGAAATYAQWQQNSGSHAVTSRPAAGSSKSMNQENLAQLLDWLLSERLRSPSGAYATAAPKRVRRLLSLILDASRNESHTSTLPLDDDMMPRIQALAPKVRDALRRYYVFGETGESIASSIGVSVLEFHRMRVRARDFVLNRPRNESGSPA